MDVKFKLAINAIFWVIPIIIIIIIICTNDIEFFKTVKLLIFIKQRVIFLQFYFYAYTVPAQSPAIPFFKRKLGT